MSYNSKKTIVSMIAGIILIVAYMIYALGQHAPAPDDLKSWAIAMLVFIGISVAAIIVIQILFHIAVTVGVAVKERAQDDKIVERIVASTVAEDERDKLISLKSSRVTCIFAGIGFVFALMGLAFGISDIFALHILFGSFSVGSIVEGFVCIYFYEKGVRNE